jgi:electron transfer flavoprotein beta subunit
MNLYVLLKMVPDTVEELNVSADGKSLDSEFLRFKLSEPDDHALEQALILKEKHGGKVTVVALDAPEVDDVLFTALAKGADRAVKIPINQAGLGTVASAKVLADFLAAANAITPDSLLLPGSQAIDDLEGEVAPFLAAALNLPFVGVVCGVRSVADGKATVMKEFAGGLRAEFEVTIEEADLTPPERLIHLEIDRMYKPEAAGRAQMFEGATEEVADKLVEVLAKNSVI